jgi:hypothetical protein
MKELGLILIGAVILFIVLNIIAKGKSSGSSNDELIKLASTKEAISLEPMNLNI